MHGWPFLSYFTKRQHTSVTSAVFPPKLSATVDGSLGSGHPRKAACFCATSYWRGVGLPLTLSPRSLHLAQNRAGSSGPPWLFFLHDFSRSSPFGREGFSLVLATWFSPRMSDGWVAGAAAPSSCVLGPLLFCPRSHQTVSGTHETPCSSSTFSPLPAAAGGHLGSV